MSKKYYLIDFENVGSAGLGGIGDLSSDCEVLLFYTKKSSKISIDLLETLRSLKTVFRTVSVAGGKEALDNQLDSYLGYLIGTNGKNAEYNIVSKDKGFRVMQSFWEDYSITIKTSIAEEENNIAEEENKTPEEKEETEGEDKTFQKEIITESAPVPAPKKDSVQAKKGDKTVINSEIQKVLSKSGFEKSAINSVASIVSQNLLSKGGKQIVYREIIKKYGQKKGLAVYNQIKSTIRTLSK